MTSPGPGSTSGISPEKPAALPPRHPSLVGNLVRCGVRLRLGNRRQVKLADVTAGTTRRATFGVAGLAPAIRCHKRLGSAVIAVFAATGFATFGGA